MRRARADAPYRDDGGLATAMARDEDGKLRRGTDTVRSGAWRCSARRPSASLNLHFVE